MSTFNQQDSLLEEFYGELVQRYKGEEKVFIFLRDLSKLKEKRIRTEYFLDYLSRTHSLLFHGSIFLIEGMLKSRDGLIYASNKAAIAIMRSLYSNIGAKLRYPYFIDENSPPELEIIIPKGKTYEVKERGFVYVLKNDGFENTPKGSWQFIKETDSLDYLFAIETEKADFSYPVGVIISEQIKTLRA